MEKFSDWRSRLSGLIDQKENQAFEYGKNDCSLFAADVVFAQTGIDLASEYRGKYKTLAGGIRAIKKNGYSSQFDILEKNFEEVPVSSAAVGDLAIVDADETQKAICVVLGAFAVAVAEGGLVRFPISLVNRVFKI